MKLDQDRKLREIDETFAAKWKEKGWMENVWAIDGKFLEKCTDEVNGQRMAKGLQMDAQIDAHVWKCHAKALENWWRRLLMEHGWKMGGDRMENGWKVESSWKTSRTLNSSKS